MNGPSLTVIVSPVSTPPQSVTYGLSDAEMNAIEQQQPFAATFDGEMFGGPVIVNLGITPGSEGG